MGRFSWGRSKASTSNAKLTADTEATMAESRDQLDASKTFEADRKKEEKSRRKKKTKKKSKSETDAPLQTAPAHRKDHQFEYSDPADSSGRHYRCVFQYNLFNIWMLITLILQSWQI